MDDELHQAAEQLTLEEFVDALIGGARASWLAARGHALLEAANALVCEQQPMTAERYRAREDSPHSLHRTMQRVVRCMRTEMWFDCLVAPLRWDDIIARGVPRHAPPPDIDDFL